MRKKTKLNVIIFAFNRPQHLSQLFSSIMKCNNNGIELSFYIHIDGPRTKQEALEVSNVHRLCLNFSKSNKNVLIKRKKNNQGLAQSIFSYVGEIAEMVPHFVVLEDDLILHKEFFQFMSDALFEYEVFDDVWHINGWSFPNIDNGSKTYFLPHMNSWGWATWSNKWKNLITDDEIIFRSMSKNDIYNFNIWGHHNFWRHFQLNKKGRMQTWAIYWYLSIFINKAICVAPPKSLINNIGNDFSGSNSRNNPAFENDLEWDAEILFELEPKMRHEIKIQLIKFYSNKHFSLKARGWRLLLSKYKKIKTFLSLLN